MKTAKRRDRRGKDQELPESFPTQGTADSREAMQFLKCGHDKLFKLLKAKVLPRLPDFRVVRIPWSALHGYLEAAKASAGTVDQSHEPAA